ncbi:class I SAM-dependent DNA methyltransferase [Salirhabdus salicampi]|uniref:class I SAM-dependent DNA methyltransferase n=1 Tax=Salirhabdus salicampi TaxID=476102 RepID=UPI0020C283E4|nr:class I SAM-dependent methyltransferase [Salirhabdus salicampi]MCP8616929.1 class I SAM-dependent methyltransferase [Salirhabdus salicampi]
MASYEDFANVYDILMEHAPYEEWVRFTSEVIDQLGVKPNHVIDLGCGTGEITIRLANQFEAVTGVDLSDEMLAIAEQKARDHKTNITWFQQDLRSFSSPIQYDLAVSYCDVLNYITDENDIKDTFRNVYKSLNNRGVFIFDVHSPQYVNEILANQTFAEVRNHVSYIWFCDQVEKNHVTHDLTFFVQSDGEDYKRFDEFHEQKTFEINTYRNWLLQCGFQVERIYADFSLSKPIHDEADRLFFVCTKKEEA